MAVYPAPCRWSLRRHFGR